MRLSKTGARRRCVAARLRSQSITAADTVGSIARRRVECLHSGAQSVESIRVQSLHSPLYREEADRGIVRAITGIAGSNGQGFDDAWTGFSGDPVGGSGAGWLWRSDAGRKGSGGCDDR